MDLIKRNLFWCGIVLVLVSLLGVGGWEILSELTAAQEKAESFKSRREQLSGKAKNPDEIPSSKEWEEWRRKREAYESDFEAIRAHVRDRIELYEDLYFDGLLEAYRDPSWSPVAGVAYPPKDLTLYRSKEHWGKEIPSAQAFNGDLYLLAFRRAREHLITEGSEFELTAGSLTLMAGQEDALKQGGAAVVSAQKAYWGAFGIVRAFASAKPDILAICQKLYDEEMKLVEQAAQRDPAGRSEKEQDLKRLHQRRQKVGGLRIQFVPSQASAPARGVPPTDVAGARKAEIRETDFYRAVPVDVHFSCDVAVMPALVERILTHPHLTYRLRDGFKMRYELDPSSKTRVAVEMQLEMWDWEIRDVKAYLGGGGS